MEKIEVSNNDRIKVLYGRTINMGDYNSMKLEVEITTDAREDEDTEQALERVWATARKSVQTQYLELKGV